MWEDSEMHCACDMDGSQTTLLRHEAVEFNSTLITSWSGSFPTIHHNEIRDITASLLRSATTLPLSLVFSGESMTARSANTDHGVWLDIRTCKRLLEHVTGCILWCKGFLPEHVYQPFNRHFYIQKTRTSQKGEYGQHIGEMNMQCLSPLSSQLLVVCEGRWQLLKHLADMISQKRQHPFSTSAPAGVRGSGLLVYLCIWGDPVPYQGSAPPKHLIRAIIKGTAPLHSQSHSQTLHWEWDYFKSASLAP